LRPRKSYKSQPSIPNSRKAACTAFNSNMIRILAHWPGHIRLKYVASGSVDNAANDNYRLPRFCPWPWPGRSEIIFAPDETHCNRIEPTQESRVEYSPFDMPLADPRHPFHAHHMAMALEEAEAAVAQD